MLRLACVASTLVGAKCATESDQINGAARSATMRSTELSRPTAKCTAGHSTSWEFARRLKQICTGLHRIYRLRSLNPPQQGRHRLVVALAVARLLVGLVRCPIESQLHLRRQKRPLPRKSAIGVLKDQAYPRCSFLWISRVRLMKTGYQWLNVSWFR